MYEFVTGPLAWIAFLVFFIGVIVRAVMYIKGLRWNLDRVAYIRFASVYRAFDDIEEVREEADAYARLSLPRGSTAQLPLFPNFSDKELNAIGGRKRRRSNRLMPST